MKGVMVFCLLCTIMCTNGERGMIDDFGVYL